MDITTKRTIKFLAICEDRELVSVVLHHANNKVLKSICNAAANATSGAVAIGDKLKRLFQDYRKVFKVLVGKKEGIKYKSNFIRRNQLNVHLLIPPLLRCVLDSIGTTFIISDVNVSKVCTSHSKRARSSEGKKDSGI